MRGVHGDIPDGVLADRRARAADHRDELWDGVLHMSPQPVTARTRLARQLLFALAPIAARVGLEAFGEPQGLYDPTDVGDPNELPRPELKNWRVPDVCVVNPVHVSNRGTEGNAHLVIEVLSLHDEARAKLSFYAKTGCREIWLIAIDRAVEVHTLRDGAYVPVAPGADGRIDAPALGLAVETVVTVDGPRLRISDGELVVDV